MTSYWRRKHKYSLYCSRDGELIHLDNAIPECRLVSHSTVDSLLNKFGALIDATCKALSFSTRKFGEDNGERLRNDEC